MKNDKQLGNPYVFLVQNTSNAIQEAVLFGAEKNILKLNNGNTKQIIIRMGYDLQYEQALRQSQAQPFECGMIKVYSINTQMAIPLTVISQDQNGQTCSVPLNGEIINDCMTYNTQFKIDKQASIKTLMLPNSISVVKAYPVAPKKSSKK